MLIMLQIYYGKSSRFFIAINEDYSLINCDFIKKKQFHRRFIKLS